MGGGDEVSAVMAAVDVWLAEHAELDAPSEGVERTARYVDVLERGADLLIDLAAAVRGDEVVVEGDYWWVNVYSVDRAYGGPEEGGWWFDVGYPQEWMRCDTRPQAEQLRERLVELYPRTGKRSSVLGGDDWEVVIERHAAEAYPEQRPRYE